MGTMLIVLDCPVCEGETELEIQEMKKECWVEWECGYCGGHFVINWKIEEGKPCQATR